MNDLYLTQYLPVISKRYKYIKQKESYITDNGRFFLCDIADYHLFFGLHSSKLNGDWIFREWLPNATDVYIIGVMTDWKIHEKFRLIRRESLIDNSQNNTKWNAKDNTESDIQSKLYNADVGIWERTFDNNAFKHGDLYRLKVFWSGGEGDRIPTCAKRVVQDSQTLIFNAQVWSPKSSYKWRNSTPDLAEQPLLIYESHTGMAQEERKVGSFKEFEQNILPRIKDAGYNAIQLMAVQEHPYYGSFGYHVSNFFAPSSRFGTPEELKSIIDSSHEAGIKVIIDIVHSHAVSNEVEGLSRFDGTLTQFFHEGERGFHTLWGSRCFDYSKVMVLRFLLSNCRYWIEEYRVDGFRFDGITSMLYKDHGINRAFTSYADYFTNKDFSKQDIDIDALSYLYFANKLIHEIMPNAITVAEDVSGYPGLAASEKANGIGFDFRFAMGIADFWIKLLKEYKDEEWELSKLWYELNARRYDERTISYAECHDQALVGDKTIMMHLMGKDIYSSMSIHHETDKTFRGGALHKMIRFITLATSGDGYLNFMGNEFGHPEWIDFPNIQNNWSYNFARRQWSLKDNEELYFSLLAKFDKEMIELAKSYQFLGTGVAELLHIHEDNKVIAFKRKSNICNHLIFVFNFNPLTSFEDYLIDAPIGKYQEIMNSDKVKYGGKGRLFDGQVHFTNNIYIDRNCLSLYLPARTALVLSVSKESFKSS